MTLPKHRTKQRFLFMSGSLLLLATLALHYTDVLVFSDPSSEQGALLVLDDPRQPTDTTSPLVYVQGRLRVTEPIFDAHFNVAAPVIHLKRHVTMYQWIENRATNPPSYEKDWSDTYHRTADFVNPKGHVNPRHKPLGSRTFTAVKVTLGDFTLSHRLLQTLQNMQRLHIDEPRRLGRLQRVADGYFRGTNPTNPAVGDLHVTYDAVPAGLVSLVAQQRGHLLDLALDDNGAVLGGLRAGQHTPQDLYPGAVVQNRPFPIWWSRVLMGLLSIFGCLLIIRSRRIA